LTVDAIDMFGKYEVDLNTNINPHWTEGTRGSPSSVDMPKESNLKQEPGKHGL
jgi:hypothetical protein